MFTIYCVYFHGLALDLDLFHPTSPSVVDVPDEKPADFSGAVKASLFEMALALGNKGENNAEVASTPGNKDKNNAQVSIEQRKMLKELKQNIELFLNTFKGSVIPDKELNQRKRLLFTQLRIGKLNGGAKDKKQQQEEEKEAKFAGADTGEVTEPPTTDNDWENVGTIDATKQQNKVRREARREARHGR